MVISEDSASALTRRQRLQLWWFWSTPAERLRHTARALVKPDTASVRSAAGAERADHRILR